jgi:DNA-binding beta-propeller fold protein YncE
MRFSSLIVLALVLGCAKQPAPAPASAPASSASGPASVSGPASASGPAPASAPAPRADVTTLGDGTAGLADAPPRFHKPIRLAVYDGGVVVADISNNAVRFIKDDKVVTLQKDLLGPHGVAALQDGSIVVAEASGHALIRLTRGADGAWAASPLAGTRKTQGFKDGPAAEAQFYSPHGIAALKDGSILIADIGNARLRLLKDGVVSTVASEPLKGPMDLALDADGTVLVADATANLIFRWHPDKGLSTVDTGELKVPHGVAVAADGTLIIAELGADRVTAHVGRESRTVLDGLKRPAAVLLLRDQLWVADLGHHQVKRLHWK